MTSATFSSAVLSGMEERGFDEAAIVRITGSSVATLKRILAGEGHLTNRELQLIERAAGMSSGQLAALKIEPNGGPYTELASELARQMSSPAPEVAKTAR